LRIASNYRYVIAASLILLLLLLPRETKSSSFTGVGYYAFAFAPLSSSSRTTTSMTTLNTNTIDKEKNQITTISTTGLLHKRATTSTTTTTATTATTTDSSSVDGGEEELEKENEDSIIMNATKTSSIRFGKFLIPQTSIFCRSKLGSTAFVNLRPIVPGHVLVMPKRIVPHLNDLTEDEYIDMWLLVRRVQSVLKDAYTNTTAFNVAVQDGKDAGQSVPHVHVHILPRWNDNHGGGDEFLGARNDELYDKLDRWAPTLDLEKRKEKTNIDVPTDHERIDRTQEMMTNEAELYRKLLLTRTPI